MMTYESAIMTYERGTFIEVLANFIRIAYELQRHAPGMSHVVIGIANEPGLLVLHFLGEPEREVQRVMLDALYECVPENVRITISRSLCRHHDDCLMNRDLAEACWDRERST